MSTGCFRHLTKSKTNVNKYMGSRILPKREAGAVSWIKQVEKEQFYVKLTSDGKENFTKHKLHLSFLQILLPTSLQ